MQAPHRPVPSKAALRALRQLAYVASGTACGAAALVYEERRRRIKFLKQVIDNGRVLKDVSRTQKRHSSAAAVASRYEDDELAEDIHNLNWSDRTFSTPSGYQRQQTSWSERPHGRSEVLPSNVERSYERWRARQSHLGMEEPSPPEKQAKQVSRQDLNSWKPTQIPANPGLEALVAYSNTETQSTARSKVETSKATRRKTKSSHRERVVVRDTIPILQSGTQHQAQAAAVEIPVEIERMEPFQPQDHVHQAIRQWTDRLNSTLTEDSRTQIEQCWRALDTASKSSSSSEAMLAFNEDPESTGCLAAAAIHLNLSPLLTQLCTYASREEQLSLVVPDIIRGIFEHTNPRLFESCHTTLEIWLLNATQSVESELHGSELLWLQLQTAIMFEQPADMSDVDVAVMYNDTSLNKLVRRLFAGILAHDGQDEALGQFQALLEQMIQSDRAESAMWAFKTCSEEVKIQNASLQAFVHALTQALYHAGHLDKAIDVLQTQQARGTDIQHTLAQLWRSARSLDLIHLYNAFGIEGRSEADVLSRLWDAMAEHHSAQMVKSSLFGSKSVLWTGIVVRNWKETDSPERAVRKFFRLQQRIGKRALRPVIYESVLRICEEAGRDEDHRRISELRSEVVALSSHAKQIAAILRTAKTRDWDDLAAQIKLLSPIGFDHMQVQQRTHIFDPLFMAYATPNRKIGEVYELAWTLYSRVCGTIDPERAVSLLSLSLLRKGQTQTVRELHAYASSLFDRPLRLTPVDVTNMLQSYYYSYRPSHVNLAYTIHGIFKDSWTSVTKLCVPLLLLSASYEGKRSQLRRIQSSNSALIQQSLHLMDDPQFRRAALEGVKRDSVNSNYAQILSEPVDELDSTTSDLSSGEVDKLTMESLINIASNDLPEVSESDEADISSPNTTSTSGKMHVASDADIHGKIGTPGDHELDSPEFLSFSHEIGSSQAYFIHALSKALTHATSDARDQRETAALLSKAMMQNPQPISANILSKASRWSIRSIESAGRQTPESTGSDLSLATARRVIQSIKERGLKGDLTTQVITTRLRAAVINEYRRLEEHGHAINHALATSIAMAMLRADQPKAAIEMLRFAFQTPWAAQVKLHPSSALVLLEAYVRLQSADGVAWVVGKVLSSDMRIEKPLISGFKWARGFLHRLGSEHGREMVRHIDKYQDLCALKQQEQIRRGKEVGTFLTRFVVENAMPSPRAGCVPDHEVRMAKGRKQDEAWADAVIVRTVCRDILAANRKSLRFSARAPMPESCWDDSGIKRAVRRMEMLEGVEVKS